MAENSGDATACYIYGACTVMQRMTSMFVGEIVERTNEQQPL